MVTEIGLIGWRDDIGAYLIMQYPTGRLNTLDVMQIYTAHRQNTLYPNFATITYKGKKMASYFSGLKTTEYNGAPNFILTVCLDESESGNLLREYLPAITAKLLTELFKLLAGFLKELIGVKGFFILTVEQDVGEFPVLVYPELTLSAKIKTAIVEKHFGGSQVEKKCSIEIDQEKYISIFTGSEKEKSLIRPNFIVTFLLEEKIDVANYKRKVDTYAKTVLRLISDLLKKGFEEINEKIVELMLKDQLSESPIIGEKDFRTLSALGEEPDVVNSKSDSIETKEISQVSAESSIDHILEQIRIKTELSDFSIKEDITEEEIASSSDSSLRKIQDLLKQLHDKDSMVRLLEQNIGDLKKSLQEKEQNIRKLMILIKSLRKYVSY